jgi:hypothetical protein
VADLSLVQGDHHGQETDTLEPISYTHSTLRAEIERKTYPNPAKNRPL